MSSSHGCMLNTDHELACPSGVAVCTVPLGMDPDRYDSHSSNGMTVSFFDQFTCHRVHVLYCWCHML